MKYYHKTIVSRQKTHKYPSHIFKIDKFWCAYWTWEGQNIQVKAKANGESDITTIDDKIAMKWLCRAHWAKWVWLVHKSNRSACLQQKLYNTRTEHW